tara:strand:- start:270 stop:509 length:240 start_codon:yes stop_codon:yes gene_type:complete
MKYEVLNKSSYIKIKNLQISKSLQFEYSIDKLIHGKRAQSIYIKKLINNLFSIKNKNRANNFYKRIHSSEIYSKDWWRI